MRPGATLVEEHITFCKAPPHSGKNEVILCILELQPVNYISGAISRQNTF